MYFPVAGIEVSPLIPPVVAFVISFFTSMGGVSGAFLLLPFQFSVLGYTQPSVSSTNQFYNVVATPSGVYRYMREGRMLWPLALVVAIGTLPGVFVGALVRILWLPDAGVFKLFVGVVILYIGKDLLWEFVFGHKRVTESKENKKSQDKILAVSSVQVLEFSLRRLTYSFSGSNYTVSNLAILGLSLLIGVVGGIYGIGGGAIISSFLVVWFRLPVHTVSGATLMGTFITSVAGVFIYSLLAPFFPEFSVAPDWQLGLLFGLGGACGMYMGARMQKHVHAAFIKKMLGIVMTGTGFFYIYDFFT